MALLVSVWAGRVLGMATLGARMIQVTGGVVAGGTAFLLVALLFRMPELRLIRQLVTGRLGRE